MGAIQPWHVILLLIIVLLVFGPGKLPDVGKAVGQTIREFREATKSTDATAGDGTGATGGSRTGTGQQPPSA